MPYSVYILYSEKLDRYYIGHTENLTERILQHNAGRSPSTKAGRPWIIVYQENYGDKPQAYQRGLEIKRKKSRIYIEQLITAQG